MLNTEEPKVIHPEDREIIERLAKLQGMASQVRAPVACCHTFSLFFKLSREKHAADLHQG